MDEITIKEIKDWKEHPITRLITKEIIELKVDASENVYNAVRQNEIEKAHDYIGMRDAYGIVLGLADEKIEELS